MRRVSNDLRDQLVAAFRTRVCERMEIVPFVHQAEWWLASEGFQLTDQPGQDGHPDSRLVQLSDGQSVWRRVHGRHGGIARVLADLGAYKVGKSLGAGIWLASFAGVPGARVSLVGNEYDMCAPEFDYLCEALLSERGLGLKYESLQNRPRDGRMFLDLTGSGVRYEAKSWERKDSLKGKEMDAYVFCEAYQLPGLECYTSIKQNLVARNGFAVFPTTPDRPWLKEIHNRAHSGSAEFSAWHCVCSIPRSVNPYTFSQLDQDQADPSKGGLMTREKYAIAYEGKIGEFVGSVFGYQRGERQFTPQSHPSLFRGDVFVVPDDWRVEAAVDTGTFMGGAIVAVAPDGNLFVIDEICNYHYISGEPELDDWMSIPQWANRLRATMDRFQIRTVVADQNSQFRAELRNYGVHLLPATVRLETRTEVLRTYLQGHRIWFAPWLKVLPYELEAAQWPSETTAGGRFERLKKRDHTLDCVEHIAARHPRGKSAIIQPELTAGETLFGAYRSQKTGNPHLGAI